MVRLNNTVEHVLFGGSRHETRVRTSILSQAEAAEENFQGAKAHPVRSTFELILIIL